MPEVTLHVEDLDWDKCTICGDDRVLLIPVITEVIENDDGSKEVVLEPYCLDCLEEYMEGVRRSRS